MRWRQLADDVVLLQFPWHVLGIDFGRNVTLLRLRDGRLVVHSTAPSTSEDVTTIRRFGDPAWLVEATRMHDTFSKEGRAALPHVPYLAPDGFPNATPLQPSPPDWNGEIDVLEIGGVRTHEYAFFHRRSRTLVLADLIFHFPTKTTGWPRFFVRHVMRLPRLSGTSIFFRFMIRDPRAFRESVKQVLSWDFERVVVAHREPIEKEAKTALANALRIPGRTGC
ncbi:MAG: hypothetical protein ACREP1_00915 [Rhodanobacteraceae bacterium]